MTHHKLLSKGCWVFDSHLDFASRAFTVSIPISIQVFQTLTSISHQELLTTIYGFSNLHSQTSPKSSCKPFPKGFEQAGQGQSCMYQFYFWYQFFVHVTFKSLRQSTQQSSLKEDRFLWAHSCSEFTPLLSGFCRAEPMWQNNIAEHWRPGSRERRLDLE